MPAVLAAASGELDVAGLVLVEPALYDIVRGEAVIERHVGIVTEARAQADEGDLRGFWAILRPLMFGGPFDPELWDAERAAAQRWAASNVPSRALTEFGAGHHVLTGAEHRPQDTSVLATTVERFETSLTA